MVKARSGKPPTQRQLKVGEHIRRVLSSVISKTEVFDVDLAEKVITVTEVSISPDLKSAEVFVMPLGGEDMKKTLSALNKNATRFKHHIAKNVQMRMHPDLKFSIDGAFDYASSIEGILSSQKVQADLKKQPSTDLKKQPSTDLKKQPSTDDLSLIEAEKIKDNESK